MDIHKLRCVVSLAKLKNVTRAAEACYMAQSTMSSTIASVEAEVGATLFTRTNRGVSTTVAGDRFVEAVEDIVSRYDKAVASAQALSEEPPPAITIGFNSTLVAASIAPIVSLFARDNPNAPIRFCKQSISELATCLKDGRADIAFGNQFVARKFPHMRFVPVAEGSPCVYVPKDHALARKSTATIDDLAHEQLLCASSGYDPHGISAAAEVLKDGGVPFTATSPVDNEEAIVSMVEAGLGLYPASTWYRRAYEDRVACVPLELDVERMQIVIAWRDAELDAVARDFAACARAVFDGLEEARPSGDASYPSAG